MLSKSVLFAASLALVISTSYAIFSDCGSLDGSIVSVEISKCATDAKRCILRRNTNATMKITFKSNKESDNLKAVVHGVIMRAAIPFPLPNPDGCKDSGIQCPIQPGSSYSYVTSMPVLSAYPRVTVDIKWELQDSEGKDIICAIIPAKIV
ncbi:hypothetical protein ABEB36_004988 [Hypothenemus hampei]|uniref:MD-2-related lipid-recognition domain-containing protein n=1 Tax=Hypothenemus hampei TaxID=57062 RepID=A0ABD1EWK1_HYPHA